MLIWMMDDLEKCVLKTEIVEVPSMCGDQYREWDKFGLDDIVFSHINLNCTVPVPMLWY